MTEGWNEFYVAVAGAAAALAGLIIVAMSVTIKEILASKSLPSRAAATISSMALILLLAIFGLIPHQTDVLFGIEIIVASAVGMIPVLVMSQRVLTDTELPTASSTRWFRVFAGILPVALSLVGGFLVVAGSSAGLVLVAATIAIVFVTSMLNAWVLLVEVQR
jgi:modulator of FtsH protease